MSIKWWSRFISNYGGPLLRANLVDLDDDRLVENVLSNLDDSLVAWRFNATVVDATNPGFGNVAFNNADKDLTTVVSFNTQSSIDNARFDEFLRDLHVGGRIFFHERTAVNNSIMFRITGAATVDGTKVNVPVTRERDQGGNFADEAVINATFLPTFVIDQEDLRNVSLPTNAAYDDLARFMFAGGSLETDGATQVVYTPGYSQAVDYRDNQGGIINDDTHYVDTDAGVSISSNLASSTISYAVGTTLERLVAVQLQLNPGQTGTGAMLVLLTDPGGTEREFMHVNLSNQIEIDTAPNQVSGTHVVVNAVGLGPVTIDDGTWVILEFIPVNGSTWRVVPVVLKADGTSIQANDIDVDMTSISGEDVGVSRSSSQRGQVLQYKTVQIPGYLGHNQLTDRFDHIDEKWALGYARRIESGTEELLNTVAKVRGPFLSTLMSRDISKLPGVIGGTGDSVLTLPEDYNTFELLFYTIIEDGGQTMNQNILTRELEANATIANVRVAGNDFAAWDRAARTLTLHETADTWTQAVLALPRLTS